MAAGLSLAALRSPGQSAPPASPEVFEPPIRLEEARGRALRDSPALKACAARVSSAQGATRSASALPNPQLDALVEDWGGDLSGAGQAQTTLSLVQPLEAPGKRKARAEAAREGEEVERQDCLRLRLDVMAEVDRRFAELLGAQERVQIAAESLETARQVGAAVGALVDAGEVSPIESSRASSDEALARIDLQAAEGALEAARTELARVMGAADPDFGRAEGSLAEEVVAPPEQRAMTAVHGLPDMARWRAEAARREASLREARRSRWPEVSLTAGWRRYEATGEHAYVAGLALPIPLFNTGSGAVVLESGRLDEALLDQRSEQLRLESLLRTALQALRRADEEAVLLREEVLPGAHQVYEALSEGYRRGKFSLLDLLEARRALAAARARYVDALVKLNLAKADLDRLTGAALQSEGGVAP